MARPSATFVTVVAIAISFGAVAATAGGSLFAKADPDSATSDCFLPSIVVGLVVMAFAVAVGVDFWRARQWYWFVLPALLVGAYSLAAGLCFQVLQSPQGWAGYIPGILEVGMYMWYSLGAVLIAAAVGASAVAYSHRS